MRFTLAPIAVVLAAGMLCGSPAQAQVRARAGVRIATPRMRAAIVVGAYRRPFSSPFYDPFYFNAFYRPFYRPFYWSPQFGYGPRIYDGGAAVRLQVSPRETEVFIDNYYAGTSDDFDGIFQRLHIEPGSHDITLYLDGYRTVRQRIYLQPTGTFRLRYTMVPLGPGEVAEPRPAEPAQPTQPQAGPPGPPTQGPGRAPYPPPRPEGPPQTGPPGPPPQGPGPAPYPPQRGGPPPQGPGRAPYPPPRPEGAQGGPPPQGDRFGAGTLSLRVQPANADVLIDGERWEGPSGDERLVVQVSPGLHHIEVRHDGYRTYRSDVDVRPGDMSTLNVSLSRQ